jgi:hypothetical protein
VNAAAPATAPSRKVRRSINVGRVIEVPFFADIVARDGIELVSEVTSHQSYRANDVVSVLQVDKVLSATANVNLPIRLMRAQQGFPPRRGMPFNSTWISTS